MVMYFTMKQMEEPMLVVRGTSYDNPYANKKGIQALAATCTKEQYEARIKGGTSTNHGIIYKEFSPDKHIYYEKPYKWNDLSEPPADYCVRFAIDYHSSINSPCAVLFAAAAPTGH